MAYKRISPIPEIEGGTNQTTYATGDILYSDATNSLAKLTAGSDDEVLTLASGIPSWAAASAGTTGFTLISSIENTSTATIEFIDLLNTPSTGQYFITGNLCRPATAGTNFLMEISGDNGSTWETTNYNAGLNYTAYNSSSPTNANSTANMPIGINLQSGTQSLNFHLTLHIFSNALSYAVGQSVWTLDSGSVRQFGTFGGRLDAAATDTTAIRFRFSSGNYSQGRISLYYMEIST